MKKVLLFLLLFTATGKSFAQLKATPLCPPMRVNVMEGNVNDIQPNYTPGQIEKTFPCFSSKETESDTAKCGGMISYQDKGIYFYTGRDYIEIRENYNGKMSLPLMGASRSSLFQWLGYPKIKDISWDAFQTAYGTLITYYNAANKIVKLQITTKSTETLKLCD